MHKQNYHSASQSVAFLAFSNTIIFNFLKGMFLLLFYHYIALVYT